MICSHCGASVPSDAAKCPYCDSYIDNKTEYDNFFDAQDPSSEKNQKKNVIGTALIAAFFPFFGLILGILAWINGQKKLAVISILINIIVTGAFFFFFFFYPQREMEKMFEAFKP